MPPPLAAAVAAADQPSLPAPTDPPPNAAAGSHGATAATALRASSPLLAPRLGRATGRRFSAQDPSELPMLPIRSRHRRSPWRTRARRTGAPCGIVGGRSRRAADFRRYQVRYEKPAPIATDDGVAAADLEDREGISEDPNAITRDTGGEGGEGEGRERRRFARPHTAAGTCFRHLALSTLSVHLHPGHHESLAEQSTPTVGSTPCPVLAVPHLARQSSGESRSLAESS